MSVYVLFFLCIRCGSTPCLSIGKAWIMRLGWTIIKLLKRRRSLLMTGKGKNNIKNDAICILCASVALWHGWADDNYDIVLGFCLLKLEHLCFAFFSSLSFFHQIQTIVSNCSHPCCGHADAEGSEYYIGNTWSDPQHLSGIKCIIISHEFVSHLNF